MARSPSIFVIVIAVMSVAGLGLAWHAAPALAQGQGEGQGPAPGQGQGQGQGGGPSTATASSSSIEGGNDAGSGMDAGDSPASPLAIANAQRTWSANLTPAGTDADWYSLEGSGAFCAVGSVTTQSPGSVTVTSDASRSTSAHRPSQPHSPVHLALASPAGRLPLLGIEPPIVSSMGVEEGGGPPTPSRYTFAFSSRSYADLDPENDGESPEAGSTPVTAAPLPPDCAAGRLSSVAADSVDLYTFEVSDARDMTFSFAIASGDAAQLRILTPSGATATTLQDGGSADVWADEPGTWTVVVETRPEVLAGSAVLAPGLRAASAASVDTETLYIVGITDGPDPEPCRPTC